MPKKRYEVRKNDMNIINNPKIRFNYAGYFISKEEWIHPERTEQTYEIIYVTKGSVNMFDGLLGNIEAKSGDAFILEPNTLHYGTKHSKDVRFFWVHFSIEDNSLPFNRRFFSYFEQNQLFKELLHLSNLPNPPHYAVNSVLVHILSEFCRLSDDNCRFDKSAEEIYEWIRINADATLKTETAARHFGYSSDHLTRILKTNYGCGFKELTDRFLLSQARNLLCNTELYIKEIASSLNFSSDKAFIGFFKYHEGVFPSEYRNRFSKTHMNNR